MPHMQPAACARESHSCHLERDMSSARRGLEQGISLLGCASSSSCSWRGHAPLPAAAPAPAETLQQARPQAFRQCTTASLHQDHMAYKSHVPVHLLAGWIWPPLKHVKLRQAVQCGAAASVGCSECRGLHELGSCSWSSPAMPASASCSTWEVSCSSRASPCVGGARALISHPSSRATGSVSCCGLRAAAVISRRCLQTKEHVSFAKWPCHAPEVPATRWLGDGHN